MSSLPQKSPYDDKPEDGGTPMLPGENSSSATSEPGVPGPRYGDHIITISLEDLKDKSKSFAKTATIDKTETVASYNCQHSDATGSQPTIIVPGNPRVWAPPPSAKLDHPPKLEEREQETLGDLGVWDRSSAYFSRHPLEPAVAACLRLQPSHSIAKETSVFTCETVLGNLLDFASGKKDTTSFRILVQKIGRTVFLMHRQDSSSATDDVAMSKYKRLLCKAYTAWDINDTGSTSHHRLIKYTFGGLKMVVRYEADVKFIENDNGSKTGASEEVIAGLDNPVLSLPDDTKPTGSVRKSLDASDNSPSIDTLIGDTKSLQITDKTSTPSSPSSDTPAPASNDNVDNNPPSQPKPTSTQTPRASPTPAQPPQNDPELQVLSRGTFVEDKHIMAIRTVLLKRESNKNVDAYLHHADSFPVSKFWINRVPKVCLAFHTDECVFKDVNTPIVTLRDDSDPWKLVKNWETDHVEDLSCLAALLKEVVDFVSGEEGSGVKVELCHNMEEGRSGEVQIRRVCEEGEGEGEDEVLSPKYRAKWEEGGNESSGAAEAEESDDLAYYDYDDDDWTGFEQL